MIWTLILLLTLSACTDNITDQEFKFKSTNEAISIVNDAKNTSWYISSSNIADIENMIIDYNDTIILDNIKKFDTIIFNGGIQNNGLWLFKGVMYAPFNNTITLSNFRDSANNEIIHPINFDINIKDWESK